MAPAITERAALPVHSVSNRVGRTVDRVLDSGGNSTSSLTPHGAPRPTAADPDTDTLAALS